MAFYLCGLLPEMLKSSLIMKMKHYMNHNWGALQNMWPGHLKTVKVTKTKESL